MRCFKYFQWQGIDEHGAFVKGENLATSSQQLTALLLKQKILLHSHQCKQLLPLQWRDDEVIVFFKQLSQLLAVGLPLSALLSLLMEGQDKPNWRLLITSIKQSTLAGCSFSHSLHQWRPLFSSLDIAMVELGEATGQLEQSCAQISQSRENQFTLRKKISKALRYPFTTLLFTVMISSVLLLFVLPEFALIYQNVNAALPWLTQWLLSCSAWLINHLAVICILSTACLSGYLFGEPRHLTWKIARQRLLLSIPHIGKLLQASVLFTLFNTLAMTQHSGLTLLQGLKLAASTQQAGVWQHMIQHLTQALRQGHTLSTALQAQPEVPALCYLLIRPAEESGQLAVIFQQLANWYQSYTLQLSDTLTQAIEPIMLVITGLIVGSLVIAMYLPIFNLGNALSG